MENSSEFADYIVYVDESGSPPLDKYQANYPMFVLTFCIFEKKSFAEQTATALQCLKFDYFGHDQVIFHERDIRKKEGVFKMLSEPRRERFLGDLTEAIDRSEMSIISVVLRKDRLNQADADLMLNLKDAYGFAMKEGLQRLYEFVQSKGQTGRRWHVVCESRGHAEDKRLAAVVKSVCAGSNVDGCRYPFELAMCAKSVNSEGLQCADLTARPIGLYVFDPDAKNRTYPILRRKFWHKGSEADSENPRGLIVFPQ